MNNDSSSISSRPARILVVDDEKHIARFICYTLAENGYEAEAAYDGESALVSAATFSPDGILLDLMLPKLSGNEVISRLRSNPRFEGLKILLLTGSSLEDAIDRSNSAADAYCLKPIGRSMLLNVLRQHGLPAEIKINKG